jgi:hypothetical protein
MSLSRLKLNCVSGERSRLEADPRAMQQHLVMQGALPERQHAAIDRHVPAHGIYVAFSREIGKLGEGQGNVSV